MLDDVVKDTREGCHVDSFEVYRVVSTFVGLTNLHMKPFRQTFNSNLHKPWHYPGHEKDTERRASQYRTLYWSPLDHLSDGCTKYQGSRSWLVPCHCQVRNIRKIFSLFLLSWWYCSSHQHEDNSTKGAPLNKSDEIGKIKEWSILYLLLKWIKWSHPTRLRSIHQSSKE